MHDQLVHPRVQKMRAEIAQAGETLLEPGELNLLCMGDLTEDHRWNTIAEIAINEGWSFTFLPDDSVIFARLSSR